MKTAYFHARENGKLVEFKSTAETVKDAIDRGTRWAQASKFTCIQHYLITDYVYPGIHDIKRES